MTSTKIVRYNGFRGAIIQRDDELFTYLYFFIVEIKKDKIIEQSWLINHV